MPHLALSLHSPIPAGSTLALGCAALSLPDVAFPAMLSPGPDVRHELRQLADPDAEALFCLIEKNRSYLREWLPWVDATKTRADALRFIDSTARDRDAGDAFHLGIFFDGQLAGVIGHHRIDWASRAGALGYWLAEAQRGKGLMTASCRAVIRHAFEVLELHRIEIRCATANRRSRAIPERLGFRFEGVRREAEWLYDHHVDLAIYGQLRREFRFDEQ